MTGLESNQTTIKSLSNVNLSSVPTGLHGAGSETSVVDERDNNDHLTNDLMGRTLSRLRLMPCAGIIMGTLSGVFFATAGFIVKLVPNVNPVQIVVTRFVAAVPLSLLF